MFHYFLTLGASALTYKKISLEKLDSIRGRDQYLIHSFHMVFIPSLFKASSPTVKSMHIKIVRALLETF